MPPLYGNTWRHEREHYLLCKNEYVWGTYIEIHLRRNMQLAILDGWGSPPPATLCYDRSVCTRDEVAHVLIPLQSILIARHVQGGRLDLADFFMLDQIVDALRNEAAIELFSVEGDDLSERIHRHSGSEKYMSLTSSQKSASVSGAICIVGQPRTFHLPQVYTSLHRNLINALNFTEAAFVYILDLSVSTKSFYKSPPVGWDDLVTAFAVIPPTILLTEPIRFEGHNPNGTCPIHWPLGCNAQFKSLEMCMHQVRKLEHSRGTEFNWIIRVRPDMQMLFPLDDIRTYAL